MANSKLLKQAIADAKAVKETALANAKIALEEAFTPRLQSILSQKLRAESEEVDDEDMQTEELDSSEIGVSDLKEPNGYDAHTEFEGGSTETESGEPGSELDDYSKVADLSEGEDMDDEDEFEMDDDDMEDSDDEEFEMGDDDEEYEITGDEEEESDEDDMDLESIIRELESSLEDSNDDEEMGEYGMDESLADGEEAGTDKGEDPKLVVSEEEDEDSDDVIDLEEILREMEADMGGMDDEDNATKEENDQLKSDLNMAYETINSLRQTINEVNLLNAKLLFANKLFRAHNMTNEQKVKVIETLDRTKTVREVKLVYSTLAENFKYTSKPNTFKKSIAEGVASKVIKSTKPAVAQKQVISENADLANRFKKLAGIIK